jgi:hypothetical protein
MRYYIVTTTKFADECIGYLTYGATQSNWLANLNMSDYIFLSQFNYKAQNLFGPFQVTKTLFYNKTVIYSQQKYFYRIQFNPIATVKSIEETDLYLYGIQSNRINSYFKLINLIQQNKHLHCICLTHDEGEAILDTFEQNGVDYKPNFQKNRLIGDSVDINSKYIWDKNKLGKKYCFSSESDLESYIIISLKCAQSKVYGNVNKLLNKYQNNDFKFSEIYNQFIFGNAYPSDMVILNENNINVFELKKDKLTNNNIPQIEKEIKKHLYYSLFSNRINSNQIKKFNFYLIFLKNKDNEQFKWLILERFNRLCNKINALRENNITFVEYDVKNDNLILEEL